MQAHHNQAKSWAPNEASDFVLRGIINLTIGRPNKRKLSEVNITNLNRVAWHFSHLVYVRRDLVAFRK